MVSKVHKKHSKQKFSEQGWVGKLADRMKKEMKNDPSKAKEEPKPRLQKPPVVAQTTEKNPDADRCIILKKVPTEFDEKAVRNRMKRFGLVDKVLLVFRKPSTTHCGTCFVYFRGAETARKVMQKARENVAASEEDEEDATPFISLNDKKVQCHEISQQEKATFSQPAKTAADSRNLYLLMEGQIDSSKHDVSKSDMVKRKFSSMENFKKLRNTNFHVSRTRLSVKNLPVSLDEKALKQLFQEFGRLKQVKILRDSQNNFMSKGCGFIEFLEHSCALHALRSVNNNPNVWGSQNRPIVEFAIDNITILNKRRRVQGTAEETS